MRYFLLTQWMFMLSLISLAQSQPDTLYLKGGSILVGTISGNNDSLVTIRLNEESHMVIAKEQLIGTRNNQATKPELHYQGYLTAGYLIGSSKNQQEAPLSLLTEHNLGIGPFFSMGLSTGLELINESTIPIGGNLKAFVPLASGDELFVGVLGGYSLSLEKPYDPYNQIIDNRGGSFFNAEVGYIFASTRKAPLLIAFGYRYAEMHYKLTDWWYDEISEDMYFNRFSVRFGIRF
ncbi:MAG: hypothetical protein AB7S69_07610 [Salinivirgaceae bacterium]